MTLFKTLFIVICFFCISSANAQEFSSHLTFIPSTVSLQQELEQGEYPNPKAVLRRSLIIPGWGQLTNKQAWKVPIVYGLLGGLTYYSVYLTKQYHDYRAAYYNSFDTNTDLKFGPTPDYLVGSNQSGLRSNRNFLRNRRDFIYVTIGLAYALNVIDAYVFAHLRSFDVSDDLSMNTGIRPDVIEASALGSFPSLSLSLTFSKK